jgi:hypothetical protein
MKNRIVSKLVLAAVLAGALPAAASAHDCDRNLDDGPRAAEYSRWWAPAVAPHDGYGHRPARLEWRARELARIDAEIRSLDAERAEYHARFAWRPWALRRYDRRFYERREELMQRRIDLQGVAWR